MDTEKFNIFKEYVKTAFVQVSSELLDCECTLCNSAMPADDNKVVVIIGITGKNKGRILLESDLKTAKNITEIMNFGPMENKIDLYLYIAEYANIFSGRATTYINDHFKESEVRLTPPAVFSGKSLDITTPNVQSECVFYMGEFGGVKIDIGFEGD